MAYPCAAANDGITSLLQSPRLLAAVAELESFGGHGIVGGGLTERRAEGCRLGEVFREEEPVNKVVARFADGRMVKGMTADFFPTKDLFHVSVATAPAGAKPLEINTKDLKALFFVKDFAGDPQHVKRNEFDPSQPRAGRRIRVVFRDGEILVGTTTGYQPGRPGFFVVPVDASSNNERCYVVAAATREISFL